MIKGVESGKSAGMSVVGIPLPHVYEALRSHYNAQSDLVLNSMCEFLPELFGLPSYDQVYRNEMQKKRKNNEKIFSFFGDNIICGDNPAIKNGKPHPDIYLATAQGLGVSPSNCLVFEDSPAGKK